MMSQFLTSADLSNVQLNNEARLAEHHKRVVMRKEGDFKPYQFESCHGLDWQECNYDKYINAHLFLTYIKDKKLRAEKRARFLEDWRQIQEDKHIMKLGECYE